MKWNIYSEWDLIAGDIGVEYQQRIELIKCDDNTQVFYNQASFTPQEGKDSQRMIASLTFFPVISPGQYELRAKLRRGGQEEWTLLGEYPLKVIHTPAQIQ